VSANGPWTEHHRKLTVYAPHEWIEAVAAEAARQGRTKSSLIVELVERGLDEQPTSRRR